MDVNSSFAKEVVKLHYCNEELRNKELDYRGLDKNQRLGFAKQPCYLTNCPKRKHKNGCDGHIRITTPERAYELGIPLWYRVNPVDKPRSRGSIYNVIEILNIVYEFEFRSNPEIALRIALVFRAALIQKGFAPQDLPIFLSGGGVHLIINIPTINITKETAKRWNRAIEKFTYEKINPLFQKAKERVQGFYPKEDVLSINLEGHDIARLLSSSGDWRPSTHEEDAEYLKQGIIRSVYENQILIRNPWGPLKAEIENYYKEIEKDEFEKISTMYKQDGTPEDDELISNIDWIEERKWRWWLHAHHGETTANALRRKILYKIKIKLLEGKVKFRITKDKNGKILEKRIDRSKLVNQIVFILCNFCRKYDLDHRLFVKTFATVINECSGNKYELGRKLNEIIIYYIKEWENKEKREQHQIKISSEFRKKNTATKLEDKSIQLFFQERIEFQEGLVEECSNVFAEYEKNCKEYDLEPIGKQQFTRVLANKKITVKTQGKNRTRYYVGIKIKQTVEIPSISSIDSSTTGDDNKGNSELPSICKANLVNAQDYVQHITSSQTLLYRNVLEVKEKCIFHDNYDIIIRENN